jgi:GNAT superfamily N-acetyltransferase
MKVIDLPSDQESLYCHCLEEYSPEVGEGADLKQEWFEKMKSRGLRVKVAVDDLGTIGGMIHYGPIENVAVQGSDLYYVYCVWVHGHAQGPGNHQHKGMGKALLAAAEEDAKSLGARGLVAWGLSIPVFMRARWFRRRGYQAADRRGMMQLVWKPFTADAEPPRWNKSSRRPVPQPGKVVVTSMKNGWCPAQNTAHTRAKRASAEFGDRVVFQEIDTFEREAALEWGFSDALFVDGKTVRTGPPPSYEKIRRLIGKKVHRL